MASFYNDNNNDNDTTGIEKRLLSRYGTFMKLNIFVDSENDDLVNAYVKHAQEHNQKVSDTINHVDAGFDLFTPSQQVLTQEKVQKIDYQIICSAQMISSSLYDVVNTGYYMYPRSSISKSHLRLANNTGIIDAGYRGHLMGMFDVVYASETTVNPFDRHLQICAPNLVPILVNMVSLLSQLGEQTERGSGGFGSTGV